MAKKHKNLGSMLKEIKSTLFEVAQKEPYIPSIVEFCENPAYLGLPNPLYPVQRLVLKAFYRGSKGNEKLTLDPSEIELCKKLGLDSEKNGNIVDKWESGILFSELVLVWGRRSGKNFCISIIALYEAMRLLECPGGDPYKVYDLGSASPFTILTIAGSAEQAKILFNEIKNKFQSSPYFKDKFITDGIKQDAICLLTPQNKTDNIEMHRKGIPPTPGSIVIRSGHSNSNTLVGIQCFVLLFDEVATFKQTGGSSSGDQLYGNLSPTVSTFVRKEVRVDKKTGEKSEIRYYDGKIISISTPRGMDGIFYRLYKDADKTKQRLMCRLPTWDVATNHSEMSLRSIDPTMTDEKFRMEYAAEFSGTEGENFFPPEYVDKCFKNHYHKLTDLGTPGITYFAHLDPAISSHNYALVVVHKHNFINRSVENNPKVDYNIIVDHIKIWTPQKGKPINIDEIDDYMLWLNRRFHLALVTYDQWQSSQSINKLRKAGIPAQETRFNKYYKIQIYDYFHQLVSQEKLKIPFHKVLYDEMLNLQRKFMANGYRVYPKTEGEVRTDDIADGVAGACFNTLSREINRLPGSRLANMGSPGMNNTVWRSMSGQPIGIGSGAQVMRNLERFSSYPKR